MAVGLGGEQLWLSPTVANNVAPFDDQSGQGNNGTAQGGLSTVADTGSGGSYAYDFDGINDYIDCGQILDVNYDDSAAYSFWIKPGDGATSFDAIMGKMLSSGTFRGHLVAYRGSGVSQPSKQNGITFILRSDNSANRMIEVSAPSSIIAGQWNQVVVTYDGSSSASGVSVYVNGVSASTSVIVDNQGTTTTVTSAPYNIGVRNTNSVFFDGSLDDLRQYNRVLTQAEISWLATERGVLGTPPEGLGDEQLWLCPSIQDSANDLSGNNNNGVYQNGMGTVTDTAEGGSLAYDFDGTADYIRVPKANFDFLVETNSFSQSVWVRSDASSGQRTFVGGNISGNRKGTALLRNSDDTFVGVRAWGVNPYSPNTSSATNVPLSQWFHIAWVVDGTTSTLYLDGSQISQETGTFTTVTGPLSDDVLLGCYSTGTGTSREAFLDGLIDDVRIYDRALTQAEITHLATSRGVLGPPGGATHYNPFKSHAFINDFQQRLR